MQHVEFNVQRCRELAEACALLPPEKRGIDDHGISAAEYVRDTVRKMLVDTRIHIRRIQALGDR